MNSPPSPPAAPSAPNCMRCRHHGITHDPAMPYQCAALGFKSASLPSRVVFESSGLPCQLFEAKVRRT